MNNYKDIERRRYRRVTCWFPMRYKRSTDKKFNPAETKNISLGGILFESKNIFSPNSHIDIEIEIPQDKPIKAIGRVAWTRENKETKMNDVGVEFKEIDPQDTKRIEALTSDLLALKA